MIIWSATYIILKPVNINLALLALFLKLTEAFLLAIIALGHFIALLILNGRATLTVFQPEQVQALVGSFINLYFRCFFHGIPRAEPDDIFIFIIQVELRSQNIGRVRNSFLCAHFHLCRNDNACTSLHDGADNSNHFPGTEHSY